MMMPGWLARPLRRFAGTALMLMGGQAAVHAHLYPGPELPPADADLVRVPRADGVHEITDPATVRRLTAFVRDVRAPSHRVPDARAHFWSAETACFHRTAAHPSDEVFTCVYQQEGILVLRARHDVLVYRIGEAEGARFRRLVDHGIAVSAP